MRPWGVGIETVGLTVNSELGHLRRCRLLPLLLQRQQRLPFEKVSSSLGGGVLRAAIPAASGAPACPYTFVNRDSHHDSPEAESSAALQLIVSRLSVTPPTCAMDAAVLHTAEPTTT